MSLGRVHQFTSQNLHTFWSKSQFTPRRFSVSEPQRLPTQEEIENKAFEQDKFEATGLQLKEKSGTITPVEKERLGVLQAKMDNLWAIRMENHKARPNLLEILMGNIQTTQATKPAALLQPKLTRHNHNQYKQEADNHAFYRPNTSYGTKLIVHELVPISQNSHNQIRRDSELPAHNITQWQSLVTKGYEEEKKRNLDGMEANFIDALKLIGESNVNIARNGHKDTAKLKPGLNLDVLFIETAGRAGFLTNTGFDARLPLDGTYPDSAIIIGKFAFQSNNPINTIMVVEHEKTHLIHQRNSVKLLKEWEKKADLKKFQQEFQKQKAQLEKIAKRSSIDPSQMETKLVEIKVRLIETWFRKQKRKDNVELELLYESIGTMKAAHFDSEVLSGLAGFVKGFHLIEIKNGVPTQDLFHELTDYPAAKGYWATNSKIVKDHYKKTLTNYYCNKLNETQRKVFDKHITDYKKRFSNATEYFEMLQSIKC